MNIKNKNRLSYEKSPYLLQHAKNPVNWIAWKEEAFKIAKDRNKPIFLSIGYSTCHWCHVMAHESFEDNEVADILNKHFICIKVDREERPDIDNIYMKYCQLITGSGGWPLTIIMTPEKKPFFAATYIPKKSKFGRIGLLDLLPKIIKLWKTDKNLLIKSSEDIKINLKKQFEYKKNTQKLNESIFEKTYENLLTNYDELYGGFSISPKFPSPHNLNFLLRYWKNTNSRYALEMVNQTLRNMYFGGLYDHIGFGFHRYSTDRKWILPHFEKMLYDQAMLIIAYTEAYQVTKNELYEKIIREIIEYIKRDLKSEYGGFYSAVDADSEGVEGKYYTWTFEELRKNLSNTEFDLIRKKFNISETGNFQEESTGNTSGRNIFFIKNLSDELRDEVDISESKYDILQSILLKLFKIRSKRIPPMKDDKILTDWNGLIIAALAKAGFVFNEKSYIKLAEGTCDFILDNMYRQNDGLLHRFRDGESAIDGFADDYSNFIWGLIELFQSTGFLKYLQTATNLMDYFIKHFWDEKSYGFQFSDNEDKELLNTKEVYDGAIPSSNSVAAMNLIRLSRIIYNKDYEEKANKIITTFSNDIMRYPEGYTFLLSAFDFIIGDSYEIILFEGENVEESNLILDEIRNKFLPNMTLIKIGLGRKNESISEVIPYLKNYKSIDNKTTVYLCEKFFCKKPVTNVEDFRELLNSISSRKQ